MIPNTLKNFNLYADGDSFIKKTRIAKMPEFKPITEEDHVAGVLGPVRSRLGIQVPMVKITFAGVNPELMSKFGITEASKVTWTLRGAIRSPGGVRGVVVDFTGLVDTLDPGNWEVGKKVDQVIDVEARRFRYRDNGEEKIFVDLDAYVLRRNGVDELAEERAALGL